MTPSPRDHDEPPVSRAAASLAGIILLCMAALFLTSVSQPIFTDDLWWHLAMGARYAGEGLWLTEDTFLSHALGPPAPAAWLADTLLHGIDRIGGFTLLRVAHGLFVAGVLLLALRTFRARALSPATSPAISPALACLATALFIALSSYRLVQLRPQIFSVLAVLLLTHWLFTTRRAPNAREIAFAAILCGVWANVHAAFMLGPILIFAAWLGVVAAAACHGFRDLDRSRARGLGVALLASSLATLANPSGAAHFLPFFAAGTESPELALVHDEWARFPLFAVPPANLPPTPFVWAIVWGLIASTVWISLRAALTYHREGPRTTRAPDPVLVSLALASVVAMLLATRFTWLGIFPLLLLGGALMDRTEQHPKHALRLEWAAGPLTLAVLIGFIGLGDWPNISKFSLRPPEAYTRPYAAGRYLESSVWFLSDAGLTGNVYQPYFMGNFMAYWLAPEIRTFLNGSLNVPSEMMSEYQALLDRRGVHEGESFLELLDRREVDVFVGIDPPTMPRAHRLFQYSTLHLESEPEWVLIYRNLQSAIYLRRGERNRENLERVGAYYAEHGIPFDPKHGFDVGRALRSPARWASENGLAPLPFRRWQQALGSGTTGSRDRARALLASTHLLLGLHERTLLLDAPLLDANPAHLGALRRRVWSLLHLGRFEQARETADRLEAVAIEGDLLSRQLADFAREPVDSADFRSRLARLPVFYEAEAAAILQTLPIPVSRSGRNRAS